MIQAVARGIARPSEQKPFVSEIRPEDFAYWFSRCRVLLRSIAFRMLGDTEKADLAVENCYSTAFRARLSFDREGAFRSWLLRVLIDEALVILRRNRMRMAGAVQPFPARGGKDSTDRHPGRTR